MTHFLKTKDNSTTATEQTKAVKGKEKRIITYMCPKKKKKKSTITLGYILVVIKMGGGITLFAYWRVWD